MWIEDIDAETPVPPILAFFFKDCVAAGPLIQLTMIKMVTLVFVILRCSVTF